ncbi:MAG: ABC transporter permease [Anaerolineae bacterium]|nr:ABC transporter permease [Anaerolineae bacterium]
MRIWSVFVKSLREQSRDLLVLGLTLVFAPLFVLIYWLWFPSGSTTYTVLVINKDQGVELDDGTTWSAADEAIQAIESVTYADGNPMLTVKPVAGRNEAEKALRDRSGLVFIDFSEDFSRTVQAIRQGSTSLSVPLTFGGDLTNPYYPVAAILATGAVDHYVQVTTDHQPLVTYLEEPLGASGTRNEFEIYVPGLLVMGAILLIFQASMAVAREVEAGTLRRLQITRVSAFELMAGTTAVLMLVSIVATLLTYLTAVALGFHSQGPLWLAVVISMVTTFSIIGIGLVMACFARTVAQAFVVANFPFAFLLFFSGTAFPLPRMTMFTIAGQGIALNDLLPPTHAAIALNKIFTLGAGFGDVLYELIALTVLSLLYFAVGVWLFQRTHLRAEG